MRLQALLSHENSLEPLAALLAERGHEVTRALTERLAEHLAAGGGVDLVALPSSGDTAVIAARCCAIRAIRASAPDVLLAVVGPTPERAALDQFLAAGADALLVTSLGAPLLEAQLLTIEKAARRQAAARAAPEAGHAESFRGMADRFASVGQLAAALGHEINNPLAYVLTNLNLVIEQLAERPAGRGPPAQDEAIEMLREAREGAERVRLIVRDLRTFSQAEGEERGPVDPRRVLDAPATPARAALRHASSKREVTMSTPSPGSKDGKPARGRLLVIDDEPPVARAIARFLREHEVTVVESGGAALEAIRRGASFDAILCDLMMPDLTGMEVHALLQAERPELAARMIFMTGGIFTDQAAEFLDRVANPRLEKPFDPAAVKRAVAEMVSSPPTPSPAT